MSFLYPKLGLLGLIALLILFFSKKITFTHIDFFKKKSKFSLPLLDILIIVFFSLSIMYPVKEKTTFFTKSTIYNLAKKHVIIIIDDSLSMRENFVFDDALDKAASIVNNNKNAEIMIVIFEKDYKIYVPFTKDIKRIKKALFKLTPNAVTNIGGSMLRDSVAGIINAFKVYKPDIYILSDGSENDASSIDFNELKKISKDVNVKYIGFGDSKNNEIYRKIFHFNKIQNKDIKKNVTVKEKEPVFWFVYVLMGLLFIKILRLRFESFNIYF